MRKPYRVDITSRKSYLVLEVPDAHDRTTKSIVQAVRFRVPEVQDLQQSPRLQQAVKDRMTGGMPETMQMKREALPGAGVVGRGSDGRADCAQAGERREGHDHVHDPSSEGPDQEIRASGRTVVVVVRESDNGVSAQPPTQRAGAAARHRGAAGTPETEPFTDQSIFIGGVSLFETQESADEART